MNPGDKAILYPRAQPLAADDIPPAWLHQVREVIIRKTCKLRAGFPACVEVNDGTGWYALQLCNNGIEFVGRRDRDAVLEMLDGRKKLPALTTHA